MFLLKMQQWNVSVKQVQRSNVNMKAIYASTVLHFFGSFYFNCHTKAAFRKLLEYFACKQIKAIFNVTL